MACPEPVGAVLPGVVAALLVGSTRSQPAPTGRGPWRMQAACACAAKPDDWYPQDETHASAAAALHVCAGCPVRWECLAGALAGRETEGIWGGTLASVRRAALRALDVGLPTEVVIGALLAADPDLAPPPAEFAGGDAA